jgi:alpha-beta hydrolase superfamily lysophospholipase
MVLRPSRDPLDHGTQQRMEIHLDGQRIEYFISRFGAQKETHDLVVLKFPGTGGRAERSSPFPGTLLNDVSGLVLTWNPPGYGRSSGRASLRRIAAAAHVFFAEAISRHAAGSRVWLSGNSLGCNVALSLAASDVNKQIDGLILRNPPSLIPVVKRIALKYPMGRYVKPVAESLVEEMNAELTSPAVTAPAVFLKSMSDSVVPPKLQDRLIDLYSGAHHVVAMDGLEHDGIPTDDHERLIQRALVWLWQQAVAP